jgi:hypothetical protein
MQKGRARMDAPVAVVTAGPRKTDGSINAAFRKRAEIVHADINRQPPKPAARAVPVGSHSLGRCRRGGLPPWRAWWHENRSQGLNGARWCPTVRRRGNHLGTCPLLHAIAQAVTAADSFVTTLGGHGQRTNRRSSSKSRVASARQL